MHPNEMGGDVNRLKDKRAWEREWSKMTTWRMGRSKWNSLRGGLEGKKIENLGPSKDKNLSRPQRGKGEGRNVDLNDRKYLGENTRNPTPSLKEKRRVSPEEEQSRL